MTVMYCGKCHNPLLVVRGWLLADTDTATIDSGCPFCRRIYRFQVVLLRESGWAGDLAKAYLEAGKGR